VPVPRSSQALLFLFLLLFLLRLAWGARELLLRGAEEVYPAASVEAHSGAQMLKCSSLGNKNSRNISGERFLEDEVAPLGMEVNILQCGEPLRGSGY